MSDLLLTFECAACGKPFRRYLCQLANTKRPHCSNRCVGLSKRNGSRIKCSECGKRVYRRFGEQDRDVREKQFCSRPCYAVWRAKKRTSYPKDGARHKHRIIAEQYLGRSLKRGEVVHHIDENRQNYDPSNLAVLPSQAMHTRWHFGKMKASELRPFKLSVLKKSECAQ